MSSIEATEIRCTEESKGGLKYDVIIADAVVDPPPKAPTPTKLVSEEEITEKLKAATERRLSLETHKTTALNEYFNKVEETLRKKEEEHQALIMQKKEALDQKIQNHSEKREAYLNDIKSKLKDHIDSVEKLRTALPDGDTQEKDLIVAFEEKLKGASVKRQEHMSKMMSKLKQRDEQGKKVKLALEERKQNLLNQIEDKLTTASMRRERRTSEHLQKLKDHDQRVEMVRLAKKVVKEEKDVSDEKQIAV